MPSLEETLRANLYAIVHQAIGHAAPARSLIVYDRASPLASLVADGYMGVLPWAQALDFDATTPEAVRAAVDALRPGDLVILVQSTSFRLNEFRFRLELFNRKLAVIEHPHLYRMPPEEHATYVDALAYDGAYYRGTGGKLMTAIDAAKRIVVRCAGTELAYDGPFEKAKPNLGDYAGMKNVGGQFPIGEVFTEPKDLSGVNGEVLLFAYANTDYHIVVPEAPILMRIEGGMVADVKDPPASFRTLLDQIQADETLQVRELGFGMNRAMTRDRRLTDIGSYERMCGIHLSLGGKHTVFSKPGFSKRGARFHVDVFADVTSVEIDGKTVFEGGAYVL